LPFGSVAVAVMNGPERSDMWAAVKKLELPLESVVAVVELMNLCPHRYLNYRMTGLRKSSI
jgi:hypothetical protein